jgi:Beta protein
MFTHRHYVPILRAKRAEWTALHNVMPQDRTLMTPLVETSPKDFICDNHDGRQVLPDRLVRLADEIQRYWGQRQLFVDLGLLQSDRLSGDGRHPLRLLADEVKLRGLAIIPVTELSRSFAYQQALISVVRLDDFGVCLRLRRSDLETRHFHARLYKLLSLIDLPPTAVDLLVDLGMYDATAPPIEGICRQVPELSEWRTFTIAIGHFPKDLTGFPVGEHLLPRLDWRYWRDQVTSSQGLPRIPSYGDYTIQHPVFGEPPAFPNFSASIRYTTTEDW